MPVTKECVICLTPFILEFACRGKKKQTCSPQCKSKYLSQKNDGLAKGTTVLKSCAVCKKEFRVWKSQLEKYPCTCCSVKCLTEYRISCIDEKEMVRLYKTGQSIYQVGEHFGVAGSTIQHRLIKLGITRRSHSENSRGAKNCMYGKTHTPEAIQKIKDANEKYFSIPENREKHAILTAKQIAKGKTGKKNNSLELALKSILTENFNFDFVHQYRIDRYVFDFYIPSANLLIEADGTFWHSDPRFYPDLEKLSFTQKKNKINDEKKTSHAILKGYNLLRVWEEDVINSKDLVITQIKDTTTDIP